MTGALQKIFSYTEARGKKRDKKFQVQRQIFKDNKESRATVTTNQKQEEAIQMRKGGARK